MKNLLILALVLGGSTSCRKDDSYMNDKLDELDRKLDSFKTDMAKVPAGGAPGAMARGQQPQQPPPPSDNGPDEKVLWSVPIDGNPVKGPAGAKVTIIEGADFACPFCRRAEPTIQQIEQTYGDQVRFVFKEYVVHPQANLAALASCAAGAQGKFWEMKSAIWDSVWTMDGGRPAMKDPKNLEQANLDGLAKNLGLDVNKLHADQQTCQKTIDADTKMLSGIGADGTPTFVINGHLILGAMPFDNFKTVIDDEIKKADEAYKKGVKPEQYYGTLVAQGKKS